MKTTLIADSGSTKTDWCLTHDGTPVCQVRTKGMNPFQMTTEEMEQEIRDALLPMLPTTEVDALYFYGAGCTPEKQPLVEQTLRHCLTITGRCEVASDMLGAARGICGHAPGIACILGTGSTHVPTTAVRSPTTSRHWASSSATKQRGRARPHPRGRHPEEPAAPAYHRPLNEKYRLTPAEIIDRVYRQKLPNRFLASFALS
jgi:hypothetical protein